MPELAQQERMTPLVRAFIYRALGAADFVHFRFETRDRSFSAFDSITQVLVYTGAFPLDDGQPRRLLLKSVPVSADFPRTIPTFPFQPSPIGTLNTCDLKTVFDSYEGTTYLPPEVYELKERVGRAIADDRVSNRIFCAELEAFRKSNHKCRIAIDPTRLEEDGRLIFTKLGYGQLSFKTSAENLSIEDFFVRFSQFLGDSERGIWYFREDGTPPPTGLFPNPQPDCTLMPLMGRFIAKALLMKMRLGVTLNLSFFTLVLEDSPTIPFSDVDQELADLLMDDGVFVGHAFTFPSYDHIELLPNGTQKQVTSENARQFADLVSVFGTGGRLPPEFRDGFRAGFADVLPFQILCWASPDILAEMLNPLS
jgi:hypothetical protein